MLPRASRLRGTINLRMLWDAPGIGAGTVTIAGDKSEMLMPLNASAGRAGAKWKVAGAGRPT